MENLITILILLIVLLAFSIVSTIWNLKWRGSTTHWGLRRRRVGKLDVRDYVLSHWYDMSDSDMAHALDVSSSIINHARRDLGIVRSRANIKKLQSKGMKRSYGDIKK